MSILKLKIDLKKIDKTKLFKAESGAVYLDCTVLLKDNGEVDSYGNNGMIVQEVSKADREAGLKGAILGNSKPMGVTAKPTAATVAPKATAAPIASVDDDDLPF